MFDSGGVQFEWGVDRLGDDIPGNPRNDIRFVSGSSAVP
jgi:hypothetical protein